MTSGEGRGLPPSTALSNRRGERATERIAAPLVVASAYFLLIPPAWLQARYSILELALVVALAAIIVTRQATRRAETPVPIALVALIALMFASSAWGVDPWTTIRDAASYAALAFAAWIFVARLGIRPIVLGITIAVTAIVIVSVAYWLIDPRAATWGEAGGLQGIYTNRNTLGFALAGGLPAVMALTIRKFGGYFIQAALVAAVIGTIAATTSLTAIGTTLAVVVGWLFLASLRVSKGLAACLGALCLTAVAIAAANANRILELLGESDTINGRTLIWNTVLESSQDQVVLGFGWSRSWSPESPHSEAVAEALGGSVVFHAHNEILNWLITLGVVGAAMIILVFLSGSVFAGIALLAKSHSATTWPILTIIATLVRGLTEISETNAQGWFVLMCAIFAATRAGAPKARGILRRVTYVPGGRPPGEKRKGNHLLPVQSRLD